MLADDDPERDPTGDEGTTLPRPPTAQGESGFPLVPSEHYLIEGEIGRGGMGRVLAARDLRLGRPVAIKELLSHRDVAARRFRREALMTAGLQHPAIVNVYEAGRWPSGEPFYAMKRVSGRTLERILADSRTLDERLALLPNVIAIVEALAYAHGRQVIHRDLKPSNVIVGEFGETVVIDWGLAKGLNEAGDPESGTAPLSAEGEGLTVAGTVMGTPAYMAPEQARGSVADERADVYSLGAILFHVLVGSKPYTGSSSTDVLRQVLAGPPPPLKQLEPGVPEDLAAIATKAMAFRKEDRYPTAAELARDLKRFQTGQLVGAHRYTTQEILRRWVRRHRGPLAVAAVAAAALAALGTGALQRIRHERDAANAQRTVAEARNAELILNQARAVLKEDPTRAVAWLKHYPPDAPHWGAVRTIAADAASRGIARDVLQGQSAQATSAAFSPDGRWLASGATDNSIRLWDLSTGDRRVLRGHTWHPRRILFSADGKSLFSLARDTGEVGLWDIATGSARFVHTPELEDMALSTRGMLVVSERNTGIVRAIDPTSGTARVLYRGSYVTQGETGARLAFTPDGGRLLSGVAGSPRSNPPNEAAGVQVWDAQTGQVGVVSKSTTCDFALAPDGRSVATCAGATIEIVELSGHRLATLKGHTKDITAVGFLPDGRLISGSEDGTLRLWRPSSGESEVAGGGEGVAHELVTSPDGRKVLYFLTDQAGVKVFDLQARGPARHLRMGDEGASGRPAFSPDSRAIAVPASDGSLQLWSLAQEETRVLEPAQPRAELAPCWCPPLFAGRGSNVAVPLGNVIHVWDVATGEAREMRGHRKPIRWLAASPDGTLLASAGEDATVRLWDLRTGETTRTLTGHEGQVSFVDFSPDGSRLASAGDDRTVRVWEVATGSVRVFRGPENRVAKVAFSPDGRLLAVAAGPFKDRARPNRVVRVWDVTAGTSRAFEGHEDVIGDVAFSPDGRTLASASMDYTVRLWDLGSGRCRVFTGHADAIFRVLFSPDGRWLLSTQNGGWMRLWDVASGSSRVFHASGFNVDFSPDSQRFLLMGRLWDMESGESRALPGANEGVLSPDGTTVAASLPGGRLGLWRDDLPKEPRALLAWLEGATKYEVHLAGTTPHGAAR